MRQVTYEIHYTPSVASISDGASFSDCLLWSQKQLGGGRMLSHVTWCIFGFPEAQKLVRFMAQSCIDQLRGICKRKTIANLSNLPWLQWNTSCPPLRSRLGPCQVLLTWCRSQWQWMELTWQGHRTQLMVGTPCLPTCLPCRQWVVWTIPRASGLLLVKHCHLAMWSLHTLKATLRLRRDMQCQRWPVRALWSLPALLLQLSRLALQWSPRRARRRRAPVVAEAAEVFKHICSFVTLRWDPVLCFVTVNDLQNDRSRLKNSGDLDNSEIDCAAKKCENRVEFLVRALRFAMFFLWLWWPWKSLHSSNMFKCCFYHSW